MRRSNSRPAVAVDLRALVLPPAGIGIHTEELLVALAQRDEFRLVGLSHRPLAAPERLLREGMELRVQPAPSGFVWQHLRVPRAVRIAAADLYWSPLFTLPLRMPVPGVVTVHDLAAWEVPETLTWKIRWSLKPFLRASLNRAQRVFTVSAAVAAELRRRFPRVAGKLEVIPNGVDLDRFRPASEAEVTLIRHQLGCPKGYLLFLGTLEPRKNVAALLDAWEILPAPRPPLLLVGGSGWGSAQLIQRLGDLLTSGVRWLGRLESSETLAILQGATALVYPSRYEGFGLPVLEAMACGVPVITSRSAALLELGGGATLPVDPQDIGSFSIRLQELWSNPRLQNELKDRGLERAQAFSWRRAAEQFARAVKTTLGVADS